MGQVKCRRCQGTGRAECEFEYGTDRHPSNCPACGGENIVCCPDCHGSGLVEDD